MPLTGGCAHVSLKSAGQLKVLEPENVSMLVSEREMIQIQKRTALATCEISLLVSAEEYSEGYFVFLWGVLT